MKAYCVYILCSRHNGTPYIGMTSDLIKRVYKHKNSMFEGFTKKDGVHHPVWYETHETPDAAILSEKQIKKWARKWKLRLIEENNPEWKDLYDDLLSFLDSRPEDHGNDKVGECGPLPILLTYLVIII